MKTAIIGNSHLGALRHHVTHAGLHDAPDFWGVPGNFADTTFERATLISAKPDQAEEINGPGGARFSLDAYERVILYTDLVSHSKLLNVAKPAGDIALYSEATLSLMLVEWTRRRPMARCFRQIRKVFGGEILVLPEPLWRDHSTRGADLGPVPLRVRDSLDRAASRWLGKRARYLAQPADTVATGGTTLDHFSNAHAHRESDGASYPQRDHTHMNRDYGALLMRHIQAAIGQTTA